MRMTTTQRTRLQRLARGRADERAFLLEGPRAVRDALAAGGVAELWLRTVDGVVEDPDLQRRAEAHGVPVGLGSGKDFERLGRTVTPQGALAVVHDTERPLAEVAALPGMLLWLDGVQDPGNVGAIVRVAVAFEAAGILVGAGSAHPLGLKALRASTGLALRVPFARGEPAAIVAALGARPLWVLERDGDDVFALGDVPTDLAFGVGADGRGPGPEAQAAAARAIGIPIGPGVDSLNAAVATGIACAALRHAR